MDYKISWKVNLLCSDLNLICVLKIFRLCCFIMIVCFICVRDEIYLGNDLFFCKVEGVLFLFFFEDILYIVIYGENNCNSL